MKAAWEVLKQLEVKRLGHPSFDSGMCLAQLERNLAPEPYKPMTPM